MSNFSFFHKKRMTSEKVIYVENYAKIEYSCLEDMLVNMYFGVNNIKEIGHDDFYLKSKIIENLEYSRYYRKLIKENDIDFVMKLLADESPTLKKYVDMLMLRNNMIELKDNLADFNITRLPITSKIVINKVTYNGAKDLESASQNIKEDVSNRWKSFPCFDSYDYANENRCYNNYCFCSKNSQTWQRIMELKPQRHNFCLVGENMPKDVLPMVYMNDAEKTMLLANK